MQKDQASESVREQLALVREVSQTKVQLAQRTEQLQSVQAEASKSRAALTARESDLSEARGKFEAMRLELMTAQT